MELLKAGDIVYITDSFGQDPLEVLGVSWDSKSYRLRNTINDMVFTMPIGSEYWMDKQPCVQYNKIWNCVNDH